jgi:ankyrin repeat protein
LLHFFQSEGWSALHVAVWNNWIELIQLLLASGCDLDVTGPGGVTPLVLASQHGHTIAVQLLVGAGCDVTRRAEFRMIVAASNAKTDTIVGSNYFRCRNVTAVHLAARYGHLDALRCLVSAGASVDAAMTVADHVGGVTPLHLAVEAGHIDVIDYLIVAGSDVNTSTRALTSGRRFIAKQALPRSVVLPTIADDFKLKPMRRLV